MPPSFAPVSAGIPGAATGDRVIIPTRSSRTSRKDVRAPTGGSEERQGASSRTSRKNVRAPTGEGENRSQGKTVAHVPEERPSIYREERGPESGKAGRD